MNRAITIQIFDRKSNKMIPLKGIIDDSGEIIQSEDLRTDVFLPHDAVIITFQRKIINQTK